MKTCAHVTRSPLGPLFIAVEGAGVLLRLEFVKGRSLDELADLDATRGDELAWSERECAHVARELAEYFAGERREFGLACRPRGTAFQREVWTTLASIPYGATWSYGELAAKVGRAGASRAVGRANATNPISIVLPCHRVIGSDGSLTGYGGGLPAKRALLELEGALVAEPGAAGGQLSFTSVRPGSSARSSTGSSSAGRGAGRSSIASGSSSRAGSGARSSSGSGSAAAARRAASRR